MNKEITISDIEGIYLSPENISKFMDKISSYEVKASYKFVRDEYWTLKHIHWTLTGTKENISKVIENLWNIPLNDDRIQYLIPSKELKKLNF